MPEKKCSRCKEIKPTDQFGKQTSAPSGISYWCNRCRAEAAKTYRDNNGDAIRARKKADYDSKKDFYNTRQREYWDQNKDIRNAATRQKKAARPALELLYHSRKRSKDNGYAFDLTEESIVVPEICPILGIPLFRGKGKLSANSPTIDRINPSAGYTIGNIQVVSHKANTMKSDASPDELLMFAKWVLRTYAT